MPPFTLTELWNFLAECGQVSGSPPPETGALINGVSHIKATREGTLSYMRHQKLDWGGIKSAVVICDQAASPPRDGRTVYIPVKNPSLAFARATAKFVAPAPEPGVDVTASLDPRATVAPDCSIGPYAVIGGGSVIGPGTVIHSRVSILGPVEIGRNCIIHSGAVLGADGFGFVRDETGRPVKMPALGGIRIGDEVEIGANACIDRGMLGDTVIGHYTKLDNFCHIAHDVHLGERVMIPARAAVGGGTTVGSDSWLGGSSVICDHLSLGAGSFVGAGTIVTANIPDQGALIAPPSKKVDGDIRHWLSYFTDP